MDRKWWKEAVVYQIYPRSFMDSNGDGIGDLRGIILKLDYLKGLGIDVIWLNPIYKSPNDDNGYDISDYLNIMNEFGTMEDFNELLEEAHARNIKILMDLVVNHTSDEHYWFKESKKSLQNSYRNYYIWRKGKDGCEPNNWSSFFSPSAWEYDDNTKEYYLHLFSKKQPDLNWENSNLRKSVYEIMTFWLEKGIDGFRMDVINMISKCPGLPDAPKTSEGKYQWASMMYCNGPMVHNYLKEMNRKVLSKYDVMTVGECFDLSPEEAIKYTGFDRHELNMVFHFEHMAVDGYTRFDNLPWKLTDFKKILNKWQKELDGKGWNSLYLNNHDQARQVSRFGNDGEFREESAKMLATLLHTMQGTPFIYQGEEIGMTNVKFDNIDDYNDIEIKNYYINEKKKGRSDREILQSIYPKCRDNSRTPMQWDESENAGFTYGSPWIKVNPNYKEINVKRSVEDANSIYYYYKKLISLRKENKVIVYGSFKSILDDDESIYAYLRELDGDRIITVLNFTAGNVDFHLPEEIIFKYSEILISNYPINCSNIRHITLKPYEAIVARLK